MHKVLANGARIPSVGLGTWTLKGDHCMRLVDRAIELGYRHIDTAAAYENETEIGKAIRQSARKREELFVTTKVWYTDIAGGDLQKSAEASLRRLQMDHVDLLLIHWPNPSIDLAESITALNDARRRGLTRHIGVSNFPLAQLDRALSLSEAPLVCNQVEYHPYLDQSKLQARCRSANMALVGYCPLFRGGELLREDAIRQAARDHGKTPAQVVLRWHVQQEGNICIPRTSKMDRLSENIDIFDFSLSQRQMEDISALRMRNARLCDYAFSPQWDR